MKHHLCVAWFGVRYWWAMPTLPGSLAAYSTTGMVLRGLSGGDITRLPDRPEVRVRLRRGSARVAPDSTR
jgi:hypothetical protein